jgi:peptidoglycan/LPS O-acetylase OafA/YrhL
MPELDSIRGLAILGVLFAHGFYWATDASQYKFVERMLISATWPGRMGVNLFFVLSGFLITGILIDSRDQPQYYKRFYARRALRILPAYYVILGLLLLTHIASRTFAALSSIYLSNVTPLFGVAIAYPVLWSLAVEEHFYLVWPAFVRNLSLVKLAACSVAIIAITPLCRVISFHLALHYGVRSYDFNLYTWNASDGLACGALVAILLRMVKIERRQLWNIAWLTLGGSVAMCVACFPLGIWTRQRPFGAALQPTPWNFAFAGILMMFLLLGTSPWKHLVVHRVLRFFGEISYGLYLVHVLLFDAYDATAKRFFPSMTGTADFESLCLRFLVAATASIAIAYASRRWFEQPFLQLKDKFS